MTLREFSGYETNIRLTREQVEAIKACFQKAFPTGDGLWIFASRVDMNAKGGDIDLYVETSIQDATKINKMHRDFFWALQEALGEQKIDIVINTGGDFKIAIYDVAKREGIRLI